MKVAIVGGGIAGLSAACACALRGFAVAVYEKASALEEIGAGLQLSPNGWRVLEALGIADRLNPHCFEPPGIEMRLGKSGKRIWQMPLGTTAKDRWGAPYKLVHRADLLAALAARLSELAPSALHLGSTVSDPAQIEADVIIGADGLHSVMRERLFGPSRPEYTGNVAWRALIPLNVFGKDAPPESATIWAGNGRHVVTTRIAGGDTVNFVGMIETPDPGEEGWRIKGSSNDVRPHFEDWARPIARVFEAEPKFFRWALFHRQPLPHWSSQNVILIGDAAHPMLPSFAQGAVQSLEDAWCLAFLLQDTKSPVEAGALLFSARGKRTARIQKLSLENGRMFHRAGSLSTPIYYGGMAAVAAFAPGVLRHRLDWIYGTDVTADYPLKSATVCRIKT